MKNGDASQILAACKSESERQLELMRTIAKAMFKGNPNYLIGVNGSVARRECTSGSDIDLFFLFNGDITADDARAAQDLYRTRLHEEGSNKHAHSL